MAKAPVGMLKGGVTKSDAVSSVEKNFEKGEVGAPTQKCPSKSLDFALDALQLGLDLIGMVPGAEAADILSGAISAARGDTLGAALSVASTLPVGGQAPGVLKASRRFKKLFGAVDEVADGTSEVAKRVGKKRGPKTDPTAPHNARIRDEAAKLEAEGNTIIAGGGKKERKILTPGGTKESRRPDILYETPNGELRGRNVGRTTADGGPVPREVKALEDLNGPGNLPTDFVPYDK